MEQAEPDALPGFARLGDRATMAKARAVIHEPCKASPPCTLPTLAGDHILEVSSA